MTSAYDKIYLEKAQIVLGRMTDYAVYDLEYAIDEIFDLFIKTGYAKRFENGDYQVLDGMSGVELARHIVEEATGQTEFCKPKYTMNRSEEYWLGWALAYYQWKSNFSFEYILDKVCASDILKLYMPYHEMDIREFCDKMSEIIKSPPAGACFEE